MEISVDLIVLLQIFLYSLIFLFSLIFTIAAFIEFNDFKAHCPYQAKGIWEYSVNESTSLEITSWGHYSLCGFNRFVGVTCLIVVTILIIHFSKHVWNDTRP